MDESVGELDLLKSGVCQCLGMLICKVSRDRSDGTLTFSLLLHSGRTAPFLCHQCHSKLSGRAVAGGAVQLPETSVHPFRAPGCLEGERESVK